MNLQEKIDAAWREHCRGDKECWGASNMQAFTAGYMAALRGLYVEVSAMDIEDGGMYDVKVVGSGYRHAFALVRGAEISFWYHEIDGDEVEEVFIDPLKIESVLDQVIPSPSEVFGEHLN